MGAAQGRKLSPTGPRQRLQDARLLLVTDPRPDLAERVRSAVRGGVDVVQLREKGRPAAELLPLAREISAACDTGFAGDTDGSGGSRAIFTVNDDLELARLCAAEGIECGVHLGQDDASTAEARRTLGTEAVIGRSAGTVEEVRQALRNGADYLGVGAVYATPTKPGGDVGGLELVSALSQEQPPVPWFAIGGVTLQTAGEVAEAGAPGFAVVRAVLDAEDPAAAARELRAYLPPAPRSRATG
ncbi:thiamine phosphate synthase [Rubrobacter aplysinae]|uniref:thiamine phosphate synthase n=1 Tax=Rubrobacter aplysinae TaxID=909625 RepID=UPI00069DC63F|nr:thiamine phosphate synthase [Rubrobacter aplysinae]